MSFYYLIYGIRKQVISIIVLSLFGSIWRQQIPIIIIDQSTQMLPSVSLYSLYITYTYIYKSEYGRFLMPSTNKINNLQIRRKSFTHGIYMLLCA